MVRNRRIGHKFFSFNKQCDCHDTEFYHIKDQFISIDFDKINFVYII